MLIIEDGTGKPDANSYISAADFRAWADALDEGDDLPIVDDDLEPLLLNAMYIIEANCWQGVRAVSGQALSFPRTGIIVDGIEAPLLPQSIVNAQASYALAANSNPLFAVIQPSTGGEIAKERVEGAVSVEYFEGGSGRATATDARGELLVRPYTCAAGGLFGVRA